MSRAAVLRSSRPKPLHRSRAAAISTAFFNRQIRGDPVPISDEAQAASGEKPATHAFQADVARLLDLMVHSIYSERDIFVRELISNAADAC